VRRRCCCRTLAPHRIDDNKWIGMCVVRGCECDQATNEHKTAEGERFIAPKRNAFDMRSKRDVPWER